MKLSLVQDCFGSTGRPDDAISFSVANYTEVAYADPARTARTAHIALMWPQGHVPMVSAVMRFVFEGPTARIRPAFFWTDKTTGVLKRIVGNPVRLDAGNVDNETSDVTSLLLPRLDQAAGPMQFVPEVFGTGKLYRARMEFVFEIADVSFDLANLQAQMDEVLRRLPPV